jgi:hypothetical protein
MPLFPHAVELIRENLEPISNGRKIKPVAIGRLTKEQLERINWHRHARNPELPSVVAEVLFFGNHIYQSQCVRMGTQSKM